MAMPLRQQAHTLSDINMTPLIDVMLVLLIIFIITIPSQTNAVKIDNPVPHREQVPVRVAIDLAIDFDGTLYWNQQPVRREQLQTLISQAAAQSPQPEVRVSVDKFAKYEVVAQALADLQHRGLKLIGFVHDNPPG